ncbi:MAG: transposon-encoded TnpW family protein [Oscillospiraceae bacterium]|nr:transposon-encoded TnpW family protein [Oscillospiraceae bacterium]
MQKNETKSPSTQNYHTIKKRIGTTNFIIRVHSCDQAKESVEDKMIRLIKNDLAKSA